MRSPDYHRAIGGLEAVLVLAIVWIIVAVAFDDTLSAGSLGALGGIYTYRAWRER